MINKWILFFAVILNFPYGISGRELKNKKNETKF